MFQINTDLLFIYQDNDIFTQEILHPSLFRKEKVFGALYSKRFLKYPLYTTFSLFLVVSEVSKISNKYLFLQEILFNFTDHGTGF